MIFIYYIIYIYFLDMIKDVYNFLQIYISK